MKKAKAKLAKLSEQEKLKTKQAKLVELENTQAELFEQRRPIDKKLDKAWKAIQRVKKQIDVATIKTMEADGVDWKLLLAPAHDFGSTEMYQYFCDQVYDLGLYPGGRWTDSMQPAMSIKLTYGDPESLKKNIAGILEVAPFYKTIKGAILFSISDHDLSKYAIYTASYNPKTEKMELLSTTYGRTKKKPLGKLPEAMAYLQENHWCDGKEEENTEDDEY